jgi:ATP-dependent DNA helicase DinG
MTPRGGATVRAVPADTSSVDVAGALEQIVSHLPGGGEARAGQVEMARRVAEAIASERHVVIRAGTGTGKTLGYLVPAIMSGERVVVATATKALQDQLASKDLPFLEHHLDRPFSFAILKGRSNYLCVQRLAEVAGANANGEKQLALDGLAERANRDELRVIKKWAATTKVGDRAELEVEPSDATWSAVSTTSRDCPGARRCPRGDACFAERARAAAAEADVIVVNLYLYGLDLASAGAILPEHDVVVIDEAHVLDDVISSSCGTEIGPGRFGHLSRMLRGILAESGSTIADVDAAGAALADALEPYRNERLTAPLPDEVATAITSARERVARGSAALGNLPDNIPDDAAARLVRAKQAATALLDELDAVSTPADTQVVWVEGPEHAPVLKVAPLDVAGLLRATLWEQRPAVLTSATIAAGFGAQVGLPADDQGVTDVGSPFDYPNNGLIYCNPRLPKPSSDAWAEAANDELGTLIEAAGGRTLALFTSYRAMGRAVEQLADRLPFPILAQGDLPKARLIERFSADPETCLFATMSFWQGIDVPGESLSLVTIDKLPFPRPDEPLLQARRELAGPSAFMTIDVPRAATMLAQGVGRLIRTATDRGAVAVFDPRLATARYGPKIVAALPKMRRTREQADIVEFLRALRNPPTED